MKKIMVLLLTFLSINLFAVTNKQINERIKAENIKIKEVVNNNRFYGSLAANFMTADNFIKEAVKSNKKYGVLVLVYPDINLIEKYSEKLSEISKLVLIVLWDEEAENQNLKNRSMEEYQNSDLDYIPRDNILFFSRDYFLIDNYNPDKEYIKEILGKPLRKVENYTIDEEFEDYVLDKESKILIKITQFLESILAE